MMVFTVSLMICFEYWTSIVSNLFSHIPGTYIFKSYLWKLIVSTSLSVEDTFNYKTIACIFVA